MQEERRQTHRQRTLKGGRIVTNDGHSTFDCTVRNLSGEGAKLIVTSIIGIPQRFGLAMHDGRSFSCETIWHTETEIGVRFL
ncbi:PilZ domain-containing protein [Devosia crocina]|uniref:PilZ domain-containing protein n=1 Tax=Devosia crocina TaxID=429728 RepID=A0A1I7NNV7_9HYPH|nr:PilZ domain-containing protein [Devosia crocina]SFV36342.1 PilZ domain-containing protein [Devosia crocina]